jgi:hypothetical protein
LCLRMGLIGPPISNRNWQRSSSRNLARRLRPWSVKQVRTRFDRLLKGGLITAERRSENAPWQYQVPEVVSDVSSPFANLPTAQDLAG